MTSTVDSSSGGLVKTRLAVMMFLQYAIWGAWLPILYPFLMNHRGFSLDETGMVLAAGAVGAIIGPFIAGQLADRTFASERLLGVSHLLGAVLVWFLATATTFPVILALSLLYGLIYAPTLALTNSLAFHHLSNPDKHFGPVRSWGTIGWIAAGIGVGQLLLRLHTPAGGSLEEIAAAQNAGRADAFTMSAILGVIMGIYCFTLPHTPPVTKPQQRSAWSQALREIRLQPLITLFFIAVPISIVHQFYFVHASEFLTGIQNASANAGAIASKMNQIFGVGGGGLMTIGQMAEFAVLALMPFLVRRVSRKSLLAVGIAAYAVRMAVFAYVPSFEPVLAAIALHGLCFGCFIFVAFMVVDENTSSGVRATAQNLFNLVIIGIGIIVGSWFSTSVAGRFASEPDGTLNYTTLFSIPMWIALGCLALHLIFFRGGRRNAPQPAGR